MPAIDTHHHMYPPRYFAEERERILATAPGLADKLLNWSAAASIEALDRSAIDMALLSISTPGVYFGDLKQTARLARECNEYGARLVADHPARFAICAALPLPDVDASLAEIAYAFDTLKLDAVGIMSSVGGMWPGDPRLAPVFDELNRRRAVVFVHPWAPEETKDFLPILPPAILEFPFDTTRAIASLLYEGTLARCPDLRFIFSHGGGALAGLASRLARIATRRPALAKATPEGPMHYLRQLFLDVVSLGDRTAYDGPSSLVGTRHLLFGSDFPYWDPAVAIGEVDGLKLEAADRSAIMHDNAAGLLPAAMQRLARSRR